MESLNELFYFGNENLLKYSTMSFFSSRQIKAAAILKCYDWAKAQREKGQCVICGNHSQIEKDVFDILLKGSQPLILVLARGMKSRWDKKIVQAVIEGRLLVISPFDETEKRVTRDKAFIRNKYMIDIADEVVVGYVNAGGQLEEILRGKKYVVL